jgi:hypothetical protein
MNDIPAFPRPHSGATQYAQEGMSLRDYFAAAALVGVETITNKKDLANYCYRVADEMMKARENRE